MLQLSASVGGKHYEASPALERDARRIASKLAHLRNPPMEGLLGRFFHLFFMPKGGQNPGRDPPWWAGPLLHFVL